MALEREFFCACHIRVIIPKANVFYGLRRAEGREALRQIILETAQERIEPFQDPETGEAFGVEDVLLTNLVMQ